MVSVVLPTYNRQKYLCESIESVISQTLQNWELIIVDDASDDDTGIIAEQYAKKDDRIHVIHNKHNQKLPESLNIGFRQAKGEFLTWISDDNLYEPQALEMMRNFLIKDEECMMVVGNTIFFSGDEEERNRFNQKSMYLVNTVGGCFLYRRRVLKEIGEYNKEKFLVEDYDYWLRILSKYGRIGHVDVDLFRFRRHNDSLTSKKEVEIKYQGDLLRREYINNILSWYALDKAKLTEVFSSMIRNGLITDEVRRLFSEHITELKGVISFNEKKAFYIFGAGYKGRGISEEMGDNVIAFVDTDHNKIGKKINGKEVLSIKSLKNRIEKNQILIAVDDKRIYELMCELWNCGIRHYCIMADYERKSILKQV